MNRSLQFVVILASFFLASCNNSVDPTPFDCNFSTLELSIVSVTNSSACGSNDGSFTVIAEGGSGVYNYRIQNENLQSSTVFANLKPGYYNVIVRDNQGCEASSNVFVASNSGLVIDEILSIDSGCADNLGSLTVMASGGTDIRYQLNDDEFVEANIFEGLVAGDYRVTVADSEGCIFSTVKSVKTGMPFEEIKSLINKNCTLSDCHDGSSSGVPNFLVDTKIVEFSESIKKFTANRSMPLASSGLTLTDDEIAQIACWVDDGAIIN